MLWNFLCFYVIILCIAPIQSHIFPIIVWSGMIITNILTVVRYYLIKESNVKPATTFEGIFSKTSKSALTSLFFFMLINISFKSISFITVIIPLALIGANACSVIYTIACHIKSIDNRNKEIQKRVILSIKYSWLIVSLISYYLARSFISNFLDMPFDTTLYKLMTIFFAMFFIFLSYCMLYILFIHILVVLWKQPKKFKGDSSAYVKYTLSVFFPLIAIGFFSYSEVSQQTISILKLGFDFSLKYDTRDTFFCRDKYMFLTKYPDAHFLYVSPGNYRVFIPHRDDFTISRLSCTNTVPFYALVNVENKEALIIADLEKRADMLTNDLKATMVRHTQ